MRFIDLKLGWKLALSFGVMLVMIIFVATTGLISSFKIKSIFDKREEMGKIQQLFEDARQKTSDYQYIQNPENVAAVNVLLQNITKIINEAKADNTNSDYLSDLGEVQNAMNDFLTSFQKYVEVESDQTKSQVVLDKLGEFTLKKLAALKGEKKTEATMHFLMARLDARKYMLENNSQLINEFESEIAKSISIAKAMNEESISKSIMEYRDLSQSYINKEKQQKQIFTDQFSQTSKSRSIVKRYCDAQSKGLSNVIIGTVIMLNLAMLFSLVLGIVLAVIITRSSSRGLKKAVQISNTLAEGNLDIRIEEGLLRRSDEIGQLANALQKMIDKFKEVVENVISGAEYITTASQQLSSNSQVVSQGATEQASSAEEASSAIEEMAANIHQNAENSQLTGKLANKASTDILGTSEKVLDTVDAMKLIAGKVRIIDDIAFQTNILALNAAVEAARAGEHGRGFAVVAAEVRKLAEKSQFAASEINKLAFSSVSDAENSGVMLQSLVPEIQKTASLVMEITASSMEQNTGANQINMAIQQLNNIIQQNAASAEEMATSAEELESQAGQMHDVVSFFKTGVYRNKVVTTSTEKNKTRSFKAPKKHQDNTYKIPDTFSLNEKAKDDLDNNFERF